MSKGFFSSAKSYGKNLAKHVQRLTSKQESTVDALKGVVRDTKKLGKAAAGPKETMTDRKEAVHLTKNGRKAYNTKNYDAAEDFFRRAIIADKGYALGYTYLGHTLYQKKRQEEAVSYWNKAIQADPSSEAAAKARKKIGHVEKSEKKCIEELEDMVRRSHKPR